MIRQVEDHYELTTHCPEADEVSLCCDCLGWFPMQRLDAEWWRARLELPAGRHHFRYYVRRGRVTIWHDQEKLEVAVENRNSQV